jgi:uncharacterized membrane protein (UPF0182 family)
VVLRSPLSRVSRRGRVTLVVLAVLLVLTAVADRLISIWADWLWFGETGYRDVYGGILSTRFLLFLTFGLGVGLVVAINLYLAYRMRPLLRPHSAEQHALDRYRLLLLPRMGMWITVVAGLIGLFAGISAQSRWQQWLLFANSRSFGTSDPQFHIDLGFYVFEYPFYRYLLGVGFGAVVIALLGALGLHYLLGGVRLQGAGDRMTPAARAHLTALVAAFVLFKAAAYYLDRRGLLLDPNPSVDGLQGASYTAINALLPAKEILAWISIVVAVAILVFSNAFMRNLLWPGVSLGLLGISAVVIGGIIPAGVQSISVRPSPLAKESRYIQQSIDATRAAFGLDVHTSLYPNPANATTPVQDLTHDTGTVQNVRLLDPAVMNEAYAALQRVRPIYGFNKKLDIDRYTVHGVTQDYVVGAREIDYDSDSTLTTWQNRYTVFTHGYGLVAAPANRVCSGQPDFVSGFLDETKATSNDQCVPTEQIKVGEPRIYYGEDMGRTYAVVGKSSGADAEFDRPNGEAADLHITYGGKGGVPVGSYGRRLLYAAEFRETNFLLSGVFNKNSKLLYVRNPRDRVKKVAPFLTLDGDPYPAVIGDRIVWILDAYTTASTYPYSTRVNLRSATNDAQTGQGTVPQDRQDINYLRNSVKATVDAYDGTVSLYAFDDSDPILKAWNKAFGGKLVKPSSAIPAELRQHFRYPEDQFKVQRNLLSKFHVTAPNEFYSGVDFWRVPSELKTNDDKDGGNQPPYYVVAKYPNQSSPTFQLTAAMVPRGESTINLAGLLSASYDGNGKPVLQLLELPDNTPIAGPEQAHIKMTNQNDTARKDLNILASGGTLTYGNLLSLPLTGGMLYVQPVYIQAKDQPALLKKVLLNYGEYSAYADTMAEGIEQLISSATGKPPTNTNPGGQTGNQPPANTQPAGSDAVATAAAKVEAAIAEVRAAQQSGDFDRYGKALKGLDDAMKQFEDARKAASSGSGGQPSASPSGSPGPSASPSSPAG